MEPDVREQGVKVSPMPEPEIAQCRFCLEDAPVGELMAPCKCVGTGRFVHMACLQRWQEVVRNESDDRAAVCQSCRCPFSLKPPARDSFSRLSNTQFRELRFRPPPGPIFEHITTNPYFDSSAVRFLPNSLSRQMLASMVPGCLVLQEPTAAVSIIRRDHWNKGAFLLAGVWQGLGHANSDALIGVNLAGARHPPGWCVDPHLSELEAHLASRQASLSYVTGGPVQPRAFLVLVSFRGNVVDSALPERVRLVSTTASSASIVSANSEAVVGSDLCDGALFGEPTDVLNALQRDASLQVVGAVVFQGHAVWSSTQLLAEVARGSWCLCHSGARELAGLAPLEEREEMWQRLWSTKSLLRRPMAAPCEDAAPSGCRCVVS